MATYSHFYELPVYKKCSVFKQKISAIVKNHFPKEERFLLTAQTQFCRQGRGSLTEVMEHIITAYDDKYIPREILKEINLDYKVCLRDINSYIKYLKTAKVQANN
jgi:hypothetical protein